MKKFVKIFILIIFFSIFSYSKVFAVEIFTGVPTLPKIPEIEKPIGAANSMPNLSASTGGKKCQPTDLCFSENALYMKLLKYNYFTKEVSTIATVLLYNGGTYKTTTVVDKEASEAKLIKNRGSVINLANYLLNEAFNMTGDTKEEGDYQISYEYFGYEELSHYDTANIKTCITAENCSSGGLSTRLSNGVYVIFDPDLPIMRDGGVADYVKDTLVYRYVDTIPKIKNTFHLRDNEIKDTNIEEYYIAFEPATRVGLRRDVGEDILDDGFNKETQKTEKITYWAPAWRLNCKGGITGPRFFIGEKSDLGTVACGDDIFYSCSLHETEYETESDCVSGCKKTTYTGYGCAGNSQDIAITYQSEKKCNEECDTTCKKVTKTGTCTREGAGTFEIDERIFRGYKRETTMLTREFKGVSRIIPARETGKKSLLMALYTDYGPLTVHKVLNENNEPTGAIENFIGPTLNTSLVSAGGDSKYQLYDTRWGDSRMTAANASTYAIGVSYWWLPSIMSCQREDVCGGKKGDDLLKCAENYCDNSIGYDSRANSNGLKQTCIKVDCGYDPTPNFCTNNTKRPYGNVQVADTNEAINANNVCSIVEIGKIPGVNSINNKRTITECVRNSTDVLILDQMDFLNVSCKETSSFKYQDLSTKKIIAGEGLDYFSKLKGEKECTVYLDVELWKYAYAIIHSKDSVILNFGPDGIRGTSDDVVKNTRNLMEELLDYFNRGPRNGKNAPIGIDLLGNGVSTTWNQLDYSLDKVNVKTRVTEIINNKKEHSSEYTLVRGNTLIDGTPTTTSTATGITVGYGRYVEKKMYVNEYINRSVVDVNYVFDKYCVTSDGRASIYVANAQGDCNDGNPGRNVYYTSLNATRDRDFIDAFKPIGEGHSINKTVAEIKKSVIGNDIYLKDDEFCPYHIDGGSLSCTVKLTPKPGTIMLGNNVFDGGVTATLNIKNNLVEGETITSYGICPYAHHEENGLRTIDIDKQDSYVATEKTYITGVVTTSSGVIKTCQEEVIIISENPTCSASCSIENTAVENSYEIVDIYNNAQSVYTWTSLDETPIKVSRNVDRDINFNGKYIVTAYEAEQKYYLFGEVTGIAASKTCTNICRKEISDKDSPNCEKLYKPAEFAKIKKYCDGFWSSDINGYESSSDCLEKCSSRENGGMCEESSDLPKVTSECKIDFANWGFDSASSCINRCYKPIGIEDSRFIYRPILNKDPFPNSSVSEVPGKRIIGANWIGREHYITDDDDDFTSATGAHANTNVEFVIDLTPSDIRRIREDIKKYNDSAKGNDSYLDYVYRKGVDEKGKYQSKFIHETFNDLFKVTNGER